MTDIVGKLFDLSNIDLRVLPNHPGLDEMLARVNKRIDTPGASISGYNGASSAMVDVQVTDVKVTDELL